MDLARELGAIGATLKTMETSLQKVVELSTDNNTKINIHAARLSQLEKVESRGWDVSKLSISGVLALVGGLLGGWLSKLLGLGHTN
jgi:hypothetical protein